MSGVMTLDGEDVVPPQKGVVISAVTIDGSAVAFIVNSEVNWGYGYYDETGGPEYIPSMYSLVGADGAVLASGRGSLSFEAGAGLYSLLAEEYYAWLDMDGNVIISIPFLSYTLD